MGPAVTGRGQQTGVELPEKTSVLHECYDERFEHGLRWTLDLVFVIAVSVSWQ